MSLTNAIIEEEIQTIESIFPDDLHREVSTAKAWKGASMPPSFTLRVASDDPDLEQHVYLTLHVQYSKTYPTAPATFTIKAPMGGLSSDHLKTLLTDIQRKGKELARSKQEMVFDIRQLCVDFMNSNHTYQKPSVVKPEAKFTQSLATEMQVRAASAERAQKVRAALEADDGQRQLEEERANRLANEMKRDTQRREQKIRADQERKQARERFLDRSEQDDSVVKFDHGGIKLDDGRTFNAVKILMHHNCILGKISAVEPILDSPSPSATSISLDLHSFYFTSTYYSRSQGRKRLKEVESELQALRGLCHPNLIRVYGAELKKSPDDGQVLFVLTQRPPSLTLKDVLEQSDTLRPEKAVDYIIQILSALSALASFQPDNNHERVRFCHRGICMANVGLVRDSTAKFGTKLVVSKSWYYGRLLSQHKSNPFDGTSAYVEENPVPRQWLSRDAEDSPHVYNQRRDIWDAGIIMLQMLLGVDVMTQYPAIWNAVDALVALPITDLLRTTIATMFDQTKKNGTTCSELIAKFKEAARERPPSEADNGTVVGSVGTGPRSPASPIAPVRHTADYFYPSGSVSSLSMAPPRTSRYREEWEEIEFLGKGGFGSVVKARLKLDGAIYAVKKIKLRGENDGKIYREVNALSRLNHRFIVRYHTTWIESTGVSGFETPTESGESSTSAAETNGINGTSKPGRRRNGPIFRRDLSMEEGSFSASMTTTTSFPSIRFGHSDDGASDDEADEEAEAGEQEDEEEEEEEEEEDEEEDGNLTESVYPRSNRSKSADAKTTFLIGNGTSSEDDTPSNSRAPSRKSMSKRGKSPKNLLQSHFARAPQIMYIQMEYVERQTLKEAVEDGITEKDCWRLFRQILEAVAHIASLGIIHRDIKLTNIFIGANGDVKIGDFGLATSSLAGIDPSDLSKTAFQPNLEITYGVGTALYTAPEVLTRARGNANHSKADMYSLGIVFFEMCWPPFQTSSERIEVLTKLRLPAILFPDTWQDKERQRTIITKLLQHNPAQRPSALELSNSSLLPEQEEDAYFEEARRKIHNSDEQCETFISELFQKKFDDVKQLSYDIGATPAEHSSLNDIVQEHMEQLFQLHGAVHKEPLILVPLTEVFDDEQQPVKLLDSSGRAVSLPRDLIVGFARLAVPSKDSRTPLRVKRFHVGNVYLPSPTGKQPIPRLMAVVDIIHTDNAAGAAEAELIRIVNEGLNIFPGVNTHQYEVLVSHSHIIDHLFSRIADRGRRRDVVLVMSQAKTFSQKRPHLLKLGLPRMLIDEMEILSEDIEPEDASDVLERIERLSGPSARLHLAFEEVLRTISLARVMGVARPIVFRPFTMLDQPHFRDGVQFEVRGAKRTAEAIARGGRYDHLISKFAGTSFKATRAIGVQISLEPLIVSLAENLSVTVPRLIKDRDSFGYWSPNRCDVYVVSFQTGYLAERIELTAMLWQHGIRADVMYESAIENNADPMSIAKMCSSEGILFMLWYRPRAPNRDHVTYKVKSILRNTEIEVPLQEIVPWLTSQIAEQRRADYGTSGSKATLLNSSSVGAPAAPSSRDISSTGGPAVQVIVAGDSYNKKFQRHKAKMHHTERAYILESELRNSITSGLPVIGVEATGRALEVMTRDTAWLTSDAAWKVLTVELKDDLPPTVASNLREAILAKKTGGEGASGGKIMVGLMSLKEERVFMIRV